MTDLFAGIPSAAPKPARPLTTYLIDLSVLRLTRADLATNWRAGKYEGVRAEHARGYAEMEGLR